MADNATLAWWGEQWMEANLRWWDAGTKPDPTAAFDWWWRLLRVPGPASAPQPLERLIEQGRAFLRFGEELTTALLAGSDIRGTDAWAHTFKAVTDQWQSAFTQPAAPAGARAHAERLLDLPGLGYTRQWQEQWQKLGRLTLDYHQAWEAYAAAFRPLAADALERLQRRLADRAGRGEPVSTLRELYDLWVDASEEAYLELVSTDAYARVHGRITNALMALKSHARTMMDDAAGAAGLPTRAGFDTLQQRHQELRREVASLRAGAADVAALREELAELRGEVQALRAREAGEAAPRPRRPARPPRQKSEET